MCATLRFSKSIIVYVQRSRSDHCPILLNPDVNTSYRKEKPVRLESFWLSNLAMQAIVSKNEEKKPNRISISIENFITDVKYTSSSRLAILVNGIPSEWITSSRAIG
ncbi:hypothetical protein ACH5RR_032103 [Cinchona calisaya]|uniref:Uncharacterized protein n=1 Tax=Cinchona calisaya TaxID=153742 RepID=A0ABD2YH59_9GENT